eukprot:gb/GECH01014145.1/.p1 GENE.gb/GECH01014145.1/~~gb/GECH01014145.1/.p1  ORF type:complete len:406 (+),score=87.67 gb/GECH01014145.1/:1-1218(+)
MKPIINISLLPDDVLLHVFSFIPSSQLLNSVGLGNHDLQFLAKSTIKTITIYRQNIHRVNLDNLPRIVSSYPRLEKIMLERLNGLNDNILDKIIQSNDSIRDLSLGFNNGLNHPIIRHEGIKSLCFSRCLKMTHCSINCPSIQILKFNMPCSKLKDIALSTPTCSALRHLDISGSQIDDVNLENIARETKQLNVLNISSCTKICSPQLQLPHLERFEASKTDIGDDTLHRILDSCPRIRVLKLRSCNQLKKPHIQLDYLTELKLHYSSEIHTVQLNAPQAKEIDLAQCFNLNSFKPSNLPALENLDLSQTNVSDQELSSIITAVPSLSTLVLKRCMNLEYPVIRHATLSNLCIVGCYNLRDIELYTPKLDHIIMTSCPNVPRGDEAFNYMKRVLQHSRPSVQAVY